MGLSKEVIQKTGGFKFDRMAEDIELSIRMKQMGFRVGLIPDAYVYHKRFLQLLHDRGVALFRQFQHRVYHGVGQLLFTDLLLAEQGGDHSITFTAANVDPMPTDACM